MILILIIWFNWKTVDITIYDIVTTRLYDLRGQNETRL